MGSSPIGPTIHLSYMMTKGNTMKDLNAEKLAIVHEAGLVTIRQLIVFLTIGDCDGGYLEDMFDCPSDTKDYVNLYATVRKLMCGETTRVNAGLHLVNTTQGNRGRKLIFKLNKKGKELYNKLI